VPSQPRPCRAPSPSLLAHSLALLASARLTSACPSARLRCWSDVGQERAASLYDTFSARFLLPNALFANYYDDFIDCERCLQTVTPISQRLGVPIDHKHGYNFWTGGNSGAADAIKAKLATSNVILVAWEHFVSCPPDALLSTRSLHVWERPLPSRLV